MGCSLSRYSFFHHPKSPQWTDPNSRHHIPLPNSELGTGVLCQWCGMVNIFSERDTALYLCESCTARFVDKNTPPPPPPSPPPPTHSPSLYSPSQLPPVPQLAHLRLPPTLNSSIPTFYLTSPLSTLSIPPYSPPTNHPLITRLSPTPSSLTRPQPSNPFPPSPPSTPSSHESLTLSSYSTRASS